MRKKEGCTSLLTGLYYRLFSEPLSASSTNTNDKFIFTCYHYKTVRYFTYYFILFFLYVFYNISLLFDKLLKQSKYKWLVSKRKI